MGELLQGTSFIGYSRGAGGSEAGRSVTAATGEPLPPEFKAALPAEIDRACQMAARAFSEYAALPPERRAGFLRMAADGIEQLGGTLVERVCAETALPSGRVEGERTRTCNQLRMFAALIEEGSWVDARIETADPARKPLPKPDLRSLQRPLGPVAVFCAGNFPLAYSVAGGDTASALAAGCPVIVNAHGGHLGTSELVAGVVVAAARASGMPEGVFSLIFGRGYEAGQALVRHPAVRAVGFTGSRTGGRALMDLAAARPVPIPVYAEMSSVNPLFILSHALREHWGRIATDLHGSVTAGVGQFCTKPGLVFLPVGREADQFLAKLQSLIRETAACPMLNCGIAENFSQRRDRLSGVPSVRLLAEGSGGQAGLFETTAKAFIENGVLHEEVFGPTTLVVLCDGIDDMARCAAALEGQLTASVHAETEDLPAFSQLLPILQEKAGRLIWNGYPTGLEVCHATVHGGPYPATSDGRATSVGSNAIHRWCRLIAYQNHPQSFLPAELQDGNPRGVWRLLNGRRTRDPVA